MAAIELVRDRVEVSVVWERLMKRRVEDSGLRQSYAKDLARRHDAFNVRRIMERREINALFNAAQDFVCDQDRMCEPLAAVHNAMPNRLHVRDALHFSDARRFRA